MRIEKYTDKLKVGDIVKVKDKLVSGASYKMFSGQKSDTVNSSMKNLEGQIVRINHIYGSSAYGIEQSHYNWTDEMFEGKVYLENDEEKFNYLLKPYLLPGAVVTFVDGIEHIVFKDHLVALYRTISMNIDLYNKVRKVTFNNRTLYENEDLVDWTRVKVDTPIYVRELEHEKWKPRHFAKYENGKVYCFTLGTTSFTNALNNISSWQYAKLKEDINE